jgi:hypothetical protein
MSSKPAVIFSKAQSAILDRLHAMKDTPIVELYKALPSKDTAKLDSLTNRDMQQAVGSEITRINRKLASAKQSYRVKPGEARKSYRIVHTD